MSRILPHRLLTFFASLTIAVTANAQQVKVNYYPFSQTNTSSPAIQVDLNGDGIPDFAGNHSFSMQELLSSGNGNFTANTVSLPGAQGGIPIASGDFNNDGKADLVLINPLSIAYGNGAGGFSSVQLTSSSFASYAKGQVADFNGDGRPDLAIAFFTNSSTQGGATYYVVLFINNGNGFNSGVTLYNRQVAVENSQDISMVLGDFDSDGHADLVICTNDTDPNNPATPVATLTALYGDGRGGFTTKTFSTPNEVLAISAADMNNDGTSDIVANGYPMLIYYGQLNRTFTQTQILPAYDGDLAPALADVNGDGLKDIVYAGATNSPPSNTGVYGMGFSALIQSSPGVFTQQGFYPVDSYNQNVARYAQLFTQLTLGDYNRDNRPDITLFSASDASGVINHPLSADVVLNLGTAPNGTCIPPAPVGISVCSPTANQSAANPVKFAFSANSFYPIRKMEVWIDGSKRSETYEMFANEGFSNVSLLLPSGPHHVDLYAGGFDGTAQHRSYDINVQ